MIRKEARQFIPWAMAAGRMLLGPVLIAGERCGWSGFALAGIVLSALLSDIFDGILARRWHCDTAAVRLFDTMADTVFYLCVGLALWSQHTGVWHQNAPLLAAVLMAEVLNQGFSMVKFGKPASYHSCVAKIWGLVLATAVVTLFVSGHSGPLMTFALVLGVLCNTEGLAMSLMLPVWRRDVKTLAAALRLRREMVTSAPRRAGRARAIVATTLGSLMFVLLSTAHAHALEHNQAIYVGGSAPVAPDTTGALDTASPSALSLRYKNPDGSGGQVAIDYASIKSAQPSNEVTHHLGVAPAIAVGLLAARQRRYFLTLTWTDPAGTAQVAVLEIAKRDQDALLAVIRARMPHSYPCLRTQSSCSQPVPQRSCPDVCARGR